MGARQSQHRWPGGLRATAAALVVASCGGGPQLTSDPPSSLGASEDQVQPSLTTAVDRNGGLWVLAGYTDLSVPTAHSVMGLAVRPPAGRWQPYPPLVPTQGRFQPSGDAWLATAQHGSRAYYVSLTSDFDSDDPPDGVGEGLALATIDVADGTPVIAQPRRIDGGVWDAWDEPTISASRPPRASDDVVLVAATPIGAEVQDMLAVLISNDGGGTFGYGVLLAAPGYRGHQSGPENTLVRPFLQQDPRPGQECHAYLAFGVRYPTALLRTRGIAPPACALEPEGCRSIAETETFDCGTRWLAPRFIVVDTGVPSAPDYRGFSYAVASDGSRAVMFTSESDGTSRMVLKRAAAGEPFATLAAVDGVTTWDDGPLEVVAQGSDTRHLARPTLSASATFAAFWTETDDVRHQSTVRSSTSPLNAVGVWTSARSVDWRTDGISCDALPMPLDNYMGATPLAPFGTATGSYMVAWTGFAPCGGDIEHHIVVGSVD